LIRCSSVVKGAFYADQALYITRRPIPARE
jgi:hypothetical protein